MQWENCKQMQKQHLELFAVFSLDVAMLLIYVDVLLESNCMHSTDITCIVFLEIFQTGKGVSS